MRIQRTLLWVGFLLTVNHHIRHVTATPQVEPSAFQSSLRSAPYAPSSNLRQSTFDFQGFDSGLWRSIYLATPANEYQAAETNTVARSTDKPAELAEKKSAGHSREKPFDATSYSDKLALIQIENPLITGQSELQATGEPDAHELATLSDWEYMAVKSGGGKTVGATASGPSATSAIVGFVGIIIVIGTYASSGKSTR